MRLKKAKLSLLLLLVIVFTCLRAQTVKDVDGNEYQTVTLGTQTWMKENLKVTHYRNGDVITTTAPDTLNICSEITPKYQWATEGNESKVAVYGRLYTWYAATDIRNVCPSGWHIPNDAEWSVLTKFLRRGSVASSKLLETDTTHWVSPDIEATKASGFKALNSGQRHCGGTFLPLEKGGYAWWSSTEGSNTNATSIAWSLGSLGRPIREYNEEIEGLPVRCLKD